MSAHCTRSTLFAVLQSFAGGRIGVDITSPLVVDSKNRAIAVSEATQKLISSKKYRHSWPSQLAATESANYFSKASILSKSA
jgi:hypothetical protein